MRIAFVSFLMAIASVGIAGAQSGPATVTLLEGWRTTSGTYMAAFDIHLEPGWKTYWRAPGDSGIPPRVDWGASSNVKSASFHWPRPGIYDEKGTRTVGYKNRLVLPVEVTPLDPNATVTMAGELEIGVCLDVCVPMGFRFSVDLPENGDPNPDITTALSDGSEQVAGTTVRGLACEFDPISDGLRVEASFDRSPLKNPMAAVFEHQDRGIWISSAEVQTKGGATKITADLVPPDAQPFAVDRSMITLTLIGDNSALEILGCPAG